MKTVQALTSKTLLEMSVSLLKKKKKVLPTKEKMGLLRTVGNPINIFGSVVLRVLLTRLSIMTSHSKRCIVLLKVHSSTLTLKTKHNLQHLELCWHNDSTNYPLKQSIFHPHAKFPIMWITIEMTGLLCDLCFMPRDTFDNGQWTILPTIL